MPTQPDSHREGQGGSSHVESPIHSLASSFLKQSKLSGQRFQTYKTESGGVSEDERGWQVLPSITASLFREDKGAIKMDLPCVMA